VIDAHLKGRQRLELGRVTMADLGCFPLLSIAEQGGIDLGDFPSARAWADRFRALPGYLAMPWPPQKVTP
jgi:glutathione S-transferase